MKQKGREKGNRVWSACRGAQQVYSQRKRIENVKTGQGSRAGVHNEQIVRRRKRASTGQSRQLVLGYSSRHQGSDMLAHESRHGTLNP